MGDENRDGATAVPVAASKRSTALSLLVMSPAGTTTVPVPASGTLVLGRAEECDVRIDDPKLSRRHAELRAGATVEIVDLGSMNGSFVRDERLPPHAPAAIGIGDAISIGNTVLVLQRSPHVADRPFHLWTHGEFEARLDAECERAQHEETSFGVARLRLLHEGAGAETQKGASPPTIFALWLREAEMVAKYGPKDYEILLLDTAAADVDARANDLASRLAASGTEFELGVAACPRDGRTPDALLAQAARPLGSRGARGSRSVAASTPAAGTLERMDRVVRRVAAGVINVLILGETGVGKELLARRIHELSPRAGRPLVSLNCAALAESLLESELFGHERGAFTGAVQPKVGLIESADGGTLFLDEVGEMPAATQAKLLRVLEQREVTRVGALRPRVIDVRFIAATNRDLEREVTEGRFRQDLYFRLNGISLSVPPLRERPDEIGLLARTFIEQVSRVMGRDPPPRLSPEALTMLQRYRWPGNIRELRNVIERAVLLGSGQMITSEHLPVERLESVPPPGESSAAALLSAAESAPTADLGSAERERILDALERCVWNQSQAAKLLGISRGTLIKRIEEYGLPRPRKRD